VGSGECTEKKRHGLRKTKEECEAVIADWTLFSPLGVVDKPWERKDPYCNGGTRMYLCWSRERKLPHKQVKSRFPSPHAITLHQDSIGGICAKKCETGTIPRWRGIWEGADSPISCGMPKLLAHTVCELCRQSVQTGRY